MGKGGAGAERVAMKYPTGIGAGDFHLYPNVPQTPEVNHLIRTLGEDGRPVFLSEYGIGSMMDVIHECRMYEQHGIPDYAEDYVLIRSMADRFSADWTRFGMESVYPFPETLLQQSQLSMARHQTPRLQSDPLQPEDLRLQSHRHARSRIDRRRPLAVLARLEAWCLRCRAGWMGARPLVPLCRTHPYLHRPASHA